MNIVDGLQNKLHIWILYEKIDGIGFRIIENGLKIKEILAVKVSPLELTSR